MEKILKLYTYVDGTNNTPFPSSEEQVIIGSFTYTANRMGSAPSITATVKHRLCLDDLWNDKVYAEFNGEKYFVINTPSSSKSNDDTRYEHDLELLSEREVLNHVYFIDAVQGDSDIDQYKSNSTKVQFYGNLEQFVGRLNASLSYRNLGYSAVIDDGISTEDKNVTFEDKYILEALQEEFNVFEIPYYFVGKKIHFGYTANTITTPFKYGYDSALLSISKDNANYALINRITGVGSSDNIPYYYPNETDDQGAVEASGKKWITPSQNLMPPIYRETGGAERFYNAKNNTYTDGEGGYYQFENEYSDSNPREGITDFEEIKPTIVGVTNSAGHRIDSFIDFAYDTNDNDEVDENGEYLHPYFFAKLRKTDGSYGFNLFDQAIENQAMQISFTSGVCGACTFEIAVGDETQKNLVQVGDSGTLMRDENGNVLCGRKDLQQPQTPQDRQNDTQNYEVWIALRKDSTTYPQVMPNVNYSYKPSTSDTFVILGINLPQAYILKAEDELEKSLIKYMWMNNVEKFTFSAKFSRIFFEENPDILLQLNENSRVLIEYNGRQHTLYIDNYTYKMDSGTPLPEIDVDLVDTLTIGKNSLQTQLDSVKQDILSSIGGGDFLKQGLKYFIRKDIADTARGKITFLRGIDIGTFTQYSGGGTFRILEDSSTYAEVDRLRVRVKAYFETLEIINTNSVGGKMILTAGGGVYLNKIVDRETIVDDETGESEEIVWDYYRCYFLTQQDGRKIENRFKVGDLAISQSFNIKAGTSTNVSNHYYWREVVGIGEDYIDLSKSICDTGSDAPQVEDVVCHLGNRTDKDRQGAIIFSAVDVFSPSITLYYGINDFSYTNKDYVSYGVDKTSGNAFFRVYGEMYAGDREQTTYMKYTPNYGVEIKGKFLNTAGENISDIINNIQNQVDGAIETWFYEPEPTLENQPAVGWTTDEEKNNHLGDLYYSGEGKAYRFQKNGNAYEWKLIQDTDITKALEEAKKAQQAAENAKSEAEAASDRLDQWASDGVISPTEKQSIRDEVARIDADKANITSQYAKYGLGEPTAFNNAYTAYRAVLVQLGAANPDIIPIPSDFSTKQEHYYNERTAALGEIADASIQSVTNVSEQIQAVQQDVNSVKSDLNTVKSSVDGLKNFTDKAFSDGLVDRNEATSIAKYINSIETFSKDVSESYNKVYNNELLAGTAKTELNNAYTAFNTAKTELVNTINGVIKDGKVDSNEKANVDGKYSAFNTKYGDFIAYLNAANKYIQDVINKNALDALKKIGEFDYLKAALKEYTSIEGGLIQSSTLALGYTSSSGYVVMAGTNGIYDDSKLGGGIASWWGGAMFDRFEYRDDNMPENVAKGLVRMDGTGYFANGNLWWESDGTLHADPLSFFVGEETVGDVLGLFQFVKSDAGIEYVIPQYPFQNLEVGNYIQIGKAQLYWDETNKAFYVRHEDGVTPVGFYATGFISSIGVNSDAGGSVSGATKLSELSDVQLGPLSTNQILSWNGNKWTNVNMPESGASNWDEVEGKPSVFKTNIENITDLHSSWDSALKAQKPNWLTTVKIETISDLNSKWDTLLKADPSAYVMRWPNFSEVGSKPTTLSGYGITDAPTKTGSGASGTWGISISGTAAKAAALATARTINDVAFNGTANIQLTGMYAENLSGKTLSLNTLNLSGGTPKVKWYTCPTDGGGSGITGRPNDNSKNAFSLRCEVIRWASSADYITKQVYTQGNKKRSWVRYIKSGTASAWEETIGSSNYTSYTVTKTGGGASGTWGISITGNSTTSTKLQTARTLWGQSFNGTGNVSGNMTGVGSISMKNNTTLRGTMASSDYWQIVGSGSSDGGSVAFETGDNGNEAIYFRQRNSSGVVHSITLMDGSGNQSFLSVTASGMFKANGGITVPSSKTIKLGSGTISWDSTNNCFHFSHGLYSDSFVSAKGVNDDSGSSSGGSYDRLDDWADYTANASTWVLSAKLGYGLYQDVNSLKSGSALNFITSGTGNVVSAISKSGTTVKVTKGITALTQDSADSRYVNVSGDTMTGTLTISTADLGTQLIINRNNAISLPAITYKNTSGILGRIGVGGSVNGNSAGQPCFAPGTSTTLYPLLHAGNYTGTLDTRYVKKAGDTMTGALNFANNTWNKVGNDVYMGDHNRANYFCLKAILGTTVGINFYNSSDGDLGKLASANGTLQWKSNTVWHAGNDGSGSGLDADLLDGFQRTYRSSTDNKSYQKLFTLKITGGHTNSPIVFSIKGRSGREAFVALRFNNANTNDPTISYFQGWGGYSGYYTRLRAYKTATSTWEIWQISQAETYDSVYVWGVQTTDNVSFTWNGNASTSLPTSTTYTNCTTATIYANVSGNASTATKLQTARQINGTNFDGFSNITTAKWGTARNIYIQDSSASHTGSAVSVNGSANVYLKLPSTISASLSGNASTATNADKLDNVHLNGIFTRFSANGNNTRLVIGGVTKDLTVPYAKNSDTVDSWHGVGTSGNVLRKSGYVTSDKAGLSSYWCKLASFTWGGQYNDQDITLYLHSAYNEKRAIVHLRFRWSSINSTNRKCHILAGNINASDIRLYYSTSSPSENIELWYNTNGQYNFMGAVVLSETNRTSTETGRITLYSTNFTSAQTLPSKSYINAEYITIGNSISGNAASSTRLQTSRTIWGQSFNGTGNVSGNMTDVGSISMNNNTTLRGTMASSDYWQIVGSGSSDGGSVAFETGDNGNEAIYFRQRNSSGVVHSITLMDGSGNQSFLSVTASGMFKANGGITVPSSKTIKLGSGTISWDSTNNCFHFSHGLYSDSFVSAKGVNDDSGSSSGGSYDRLDDWADYTANASTWVLSAKLGYGLYQDVNSLKSGSALNFITSGTGNVVSAISKSGTTVKVTKGITALTQDSADSRYVNVSGDTMTGTLTISTADLGTQLIINRNNAISLPAITYKNTSGILGRIGVGGSVNGNSAGQPCFAPGTSTTLYPLLHAGNYTGTLDTRYVKKAGDTMTGALNFANNTWNKVGNDVYMGDHNRANYFCLKAILGTTVGINFYNSSDGDLGKLASANGTLQWKSNTVWHAGNDGSGSGLDADLLDGFQRTYRSSTDNKSYQKLFTLKITGGHTNSPIVFSIKGRSGREAFVALRFNNANTNDPTISYFQGWGGYSGYYTRLRAYKTATSTWEIWQISQAETYDSVYVWGVQTTDNVSFTWNGNASTSLPTSTTYTNCTTATIYANVSGNASTATKLQTARQINGTNFDGFSNITTAKWGTARNIYIQDSSASHTGSAVSVNGSANVYLKLPSTISASLSGNASTATNADKLDNVHLNGIFTRFSANGNNTRLVIGGVTKDLTVPYAKNSDTVDSWHGVGTSGNVLRKSGYVTSDKAGLSSYWCKLASFTWGGQYNDQDITLYLHSAYNEKRAIVHLRFRWSSINSTNRKCHILAGNINASDIRLYYSTSSPSENIELWYNTNGQYNFMGAVVLSETNRTSTETGRITLYSTNFTSAQTLPSKSYINAEYITIGNSISGNAASSTKLQTARTIWGQTFNGTANISGDLSGVLNINHSSTSDFKINGSSGTFYRSTNAGALVLSANSSESIYLRTGGTTGNTRVQISPSAISLNLNTSASGTLTVAGKITANGSIDLPKGKNFNIIGNGTCFINNGNNDIRAETLGGALANIVISSWNGLSFTSSCSGTYQNKTVVGINCRTGKLSAFTIYAKTGMYSDGYVSAKGNNSSSDIRLKNILQYMELNVNMFAKAPLFKFSWKSNPNMIEIGSSAQYWKTTLPDAVKEREGYLEMGYGNIALAGVITIAREVESIEQKVKRLEIENKKLKEQIRKIERRIA